MKNLWKYFKPKTKMKTKIFYHLDPTKLEGQINTWLGAYPKNQVIDIKFNMIQRNIFFIYHVIQYGVLIIYKEVK
jgi:hypothetical protein